MGDRHVYSLPKHLHDQPLRHLRTVTSVGDSVNPRKCKNATVTGLPILTERQLITSDSASVAGNCIVCSLLS